MKKSLIKNAASAVTLCEYIILNGVHTNWVNIEESMNEFVVSQKNYRDLYLDYEVLYIMVKICKKTQEDETKYIKNVWDTIRKARLVRASLMDILNERNK